MKDVLPALAEGLLVVTANKRLARTLLLAFNRRQQAAGLRAWRRPAVLTWHAWIEQLCSESVLAGGSASGQALLTPAQMAAAWRRIVMDGSLAALPGSDAPVADLAMRTWRTCQEWRVSDEDLRVAADSSDALTFAAWAAEYRRTCARMGWLDAGMLPGTLATDLRRGLIRSPAAVRLVGFEEWTPLQREFLRVIASSGCDVREEPAPRVRGAQARTLACHDEIEELERAARWARLRRERDAHASVAVIVPDLAGRLPQVRRTFLDIFAPDWRLRPDDSMPVNFSLGRPLTSAGLVHAALLMLRALGGSLDYRDAGQLLRSPYLGGSGAESAARASLDLSFRERPGTQVRMADLALSADRNAMPLLAGRLQQFLGISSSLPRMQLPSRWAESFSAAIHALGWPGERTLGSDDFQAAVAWREQLDHMGACDRITGEIGRETALELLSNTTRQRVFQPSGDDAAVQVMGLLEAVGHQFDALWVCGLTSDNWPPASRPDPLLPISLQRRLHMPAASAPAVRERAERLLRWIESSAPEVILSWPEFRGDEPISQTPLVAHMPRLVPGMLPLWDRPTRHQALVRARQTEAVTDDVPPPLGPGRRPLRGGIALLERQARCPARAFLEFRLGAREMRAPSAGLDAAARGSVTHAILQELFRRIPDQHHLQRLGDEQQGRLLDELISRELGVFATSGDPFVRALAREERARLKILLSELLQLERERRPFRVIGTEQVLTGFRAPASVRSLHLTLRIDRIDESEDGRRLVIDYKTGRQLASPGDLRGPRPHSPQLPIYALATESDAVAFLHVSRGRMAWLGVGTGGWGIDGILSPDKLTKVPEEDWNTLTNSWWTAIDRLAAEFLGGDFRVDRWNLDEARGQWAMAIRVHELADMDPGAR